MNKDIKGKFVWKIIQYEGDKIFKVRFGDTEIGFDKAIKSVKSSKSYTYKIFVSIVEWKEI